MSGPLKKWRIREDGVEAQRGETIGHLLQRRAGIFAYDLIRLPKLLAAA